MLKKSIIALAISTCFFLVGCQSTQVKASKNVEVKSEITQSTTRDAKIPMTLKQAMAHPDWFARSPESAYWALDNESIVYHQKQLGSELRDAYVASVSQPAQVIPLHDLHELSTQGAVYHPQGTHAAYLFKNNIFVKNLSNATLKQVTHSSAVKSQLQFLADGTLSYFQNNTYFSIDPITGLTKQLAQLSLSDAPIKLEEPMSYLAKEQHKLIDYVALMHKNKRDKQNQADTLQRENRTLVDLPYYLGEGKRLVASALSPNAKQLIVVIKTHQSTRSEGDIMPNYIGHNGEIVAEKVRQRVADAKPSSSEVIYIDLETHRQSSLSFDTLPGFDEDVLADVKTENYLRDGKKYQSKRAPRAINLMMDWGWSQSPIQWSNNGSNAAIMLEAWDNKDRWIATIDFDKQALVAEHRLHDKAWVNYTYNDFGWLNDNDTLYFLSEQSGYSHIYTKPLKGEVVQHSDGNFVVSKLMKAKNSNRLFYKANKKHPGIYEIYQLDLDKNEHVALTDLNGMTDYRLSPKEDKLLLTHSKLANPPELFIKSLASGKLTQVTNTTTDAFANTKLVIPKVVAVPSSHTEQPIYAKVYYPSDYVAGETGKKRKAVIFNHGAGYLQNSHLGWSDYFREFMFHSMLAQQGYVVMDMDYRASKGYGRDWRTAIYRQMGTPEIQDLADGVTWMVQNMNVDANRVGTYGGSYGGFMTFMALLKEPQLFQGGAALRPVSDWAHYNAPYTANILNHPEVDPIAYERSSPIYFAEGLSKPLLINAPMIDDNVFFQDVVRLVQRFIELEKENFETAIYPVEPHGFKQPSSWLDEYRRIYKLFEDNL